MSANLLDSILDSPRIVAEKNNPNAINFVAGLADPGEMIRCGYLPEIRRQDGEQDAEYAARILPIIMALPKDQRDKIMGSAIKRASLDSSNGKINLMTVVGPNGEDMPWHRLGTMVVAAVNSSEALALAGLGWKVLKVPAEREFNGKRVISSDTFLLVRDDTGAELGSVGKQYKPIQNQEGFEVLDTVLKDYGARYETAGSIYGGRKVWMQARLPKELEIVRGDKVGGFATFMASHDGTGAAWAYTTTLREVCANTHRVSFSESKAKGVAIRHTGDVKSKLNDVRRAFGMAVKGFETFGEQAVRMASPVTGQMRFLPYANEVLDATLEITDAQVKMGAERLADDDLLAGVLATTDANKALLVKQYARQIKGRENLLESLMDRYDSERCQHGTAWGGFNAFSEEADHGNLFHRYVGENKDSRRF